MLSCKDETHCNRSAALRSGVTVLVVDINLRDQQRTDVAHAPLVMVLFFLFLFIPLTFALVLTAIAMLCKPGCAIRAADTSSV